MKYGYEMYGNFSIPKQPKGKALGKYNGKGGTLENAFSQTFGGDKLETSSGSAEKYSVLLVNKNPYK